MGRVDLSDVTVPVAVLRLLPEKLIRRRSLLPLRLLSSTRGPLVVASSDPGNLEVLDEAAFAAGTRVVAVPAGKRAIERAIERHPGTTHPDALPPALQLPALPAVAVS